MRKHLSKCLYTQANKRQTIRVKTVCKTVSQSAGNREHRGALPLNATVEKQYLRTHSSRSSSVWRWSSRVQNVRLTWDHKSVLSVRKSIPLLPQIKLIYLTFAEVEIKGLQLLDWLDSCHSLSFLNHSPCHYYHCHCCHHHY